MDLFTAILKLIGTYLKTFVVGLVLLLVIVLPIYSFILGGHNNEDVAFGGIACLFLLPGIICGLIYLPIALIDKKRAGQSVTQLFKRYLPYVSIPVLIILLFIFLVDNWRMEELGRTLFTYAYTLSMVSLYMFCSSVKSEKYENTPI